MEPTPVSHSLRAVRESRASRQRGVSLIVVMLILIIVSVLGVGGAQIALMSERGARNDRDIQVAWQSAESALMDAEFDIHGPGSTRSALFAASNANGFVAGCGKSATDRGLCALAETGKPAWLTVDFMDVSGNARSAAFGDFTARSFASDNQATATGAKPARKPRYIVEPIPDPGNRDLSAPPTFLYRVTAMGFGPREDIQAVSQIIYRN